MSPTNLYLPMIPAEMKGKTERRHFCHDYAIYLHRNAKAFVILFLAITSVWYYRYSEDLAVRFQGAEVIFSDFHVYYEVARGNLGIQIGRWIPEFGANGWVYADWTATLWRPFTLLPYQAALVIWYAINTLASLWIISRILKVKHGWIALPIALKTLSWVLATGNVYPILVALCFHPLGVLVAGLVKPQLLCVGGVYALGEGYRLLATRRKLRQEQRALAPSAGHLLHSSQMA